MQPSRSYNHETAAEALFFRNVVNGSVHQAIRVEVPDLGLEFTDNAYIGKGAFSLCFLVICNLILNGALLWHREDPEGLLYYDAASDMTGNAKAKVLKVTVGGKNYVHIKFYTSYESETYAEVGCTLFLSLSALTMPFYCVSSLPKIQYVFPLGLSH